MMGLALVSGIHAPESIFEMKDCIRGIILGNLDQQKADISWICESNDYIESLLLNINRII
jgi:hypothetical protein